eukprot:TRINITY_DN4150_c0_g1::TRINITY_DN4150_c0_g1_i1::g.2048::m.2048 TRINITY_DN4150_c0_g1::TRINITY_DN4150_c0_g1_i1::g.2048  ORF type:complete len:171 (-),score=65.61,Cytochrom_B558a/PF05038.8/0.034,Cg6151-P/PF10233.4/0.087,COX2_TM/PF02790.10/1e+04,COX2_TM/PF02790.10/0.13 TRINITY_DN4150_c0_g1_i1:307-819(-)
MDCSAVNWGKWANISGKVTVIALIAFAIITWIAGQSAGIGVYTFFIGLLLSPLEFSAFYSGCSTQCEKAINFMNDSMYFKNGVIRFVIYVLLSIVTFLNETACIGGGIFLLITALLYLAKRMSGQTDDQAGSYANPNADPNQSYGTPAPAGAYGAPTSYNAPPAGGYGSI